MKSFFKMLLLVFFLIIIFIYVLVIEKIPEEIIAFQGENISITTLFGINIVNKNLKTVETSSNNNSKISEEIGKQSLEVNLFNTIPLKEVDVNVIPKTKVILCRKYRRGKIIYKWCFSSTVCQKLKVKIIKNINHMKIQELKKEIL